MGSGCGSAMCGKRLGRERHQLCRRLKPKLGRRAPGSMEMCGGRRWGSRRATAAAPARGDWGGWGGLLRPRGSAMPHPTLAVGHQEAALWPDGPGISFKLCQRPAWLGVGSVHEGRVPTRHGRVRTRKGRVRTPEARPHTRGGADERLISARGGGCHHGGGYHNGGGSHRRVVAAVRPPFDLPWGDARPAVPTRLIRQ
eukprot:scaffold1309_cov117-Isochrysis_galbana.AAC.1